MIIIFIIVTITISIISLLIIYFDDCYIIMIMIK